MEIIFKNLKLSLMALLITLSFTACDEDDDFIIDDDAPEVIETNTIVDFVNNNDDYSSLAAAIDAAGLTETLDGDANFTVFAPNNAAFSAFLSANGFASLDEVPVDVLTQVLLNHAQMGEITSSQLSTGYIESMSTAGPEGEALSLYVDTSDGVTINGVSSVTSADIEVDNGIIHAVDAVIGLPNITTFATADSTFDILVTALTREESYTFVDILSSSDEPAPFTVFAPTNDAFVALLEEFELEGLDDVPADLLAKILTYHVVGGANVTSGDLVDGVAVTTLESGEFTVNIDGSVTLTDENGRSVTVIATDVQATNGVIHAIDRVLLPEDEAFEPESNTIADIVAGTEDYSSLLAALERTELTATFAGEDEFTVFAPNNAAFDAFLSANGFASLDEVPVDILTQVLLNHVQMGSLSSADLSTGYIESMSTAGPDGENLSLYVNIADGVSLNGVSNVTQADIIADNGIIHAVDAVIGLPNITTFALADPEFEILVDALTREDSFGFVELLSSSEAPAPFTVFAPNNTAFVDLLAELEVGGLGDFTTATLEAVLGYHVVAGANVTSDEITDGMSVTTSQGESFIINLGDDVVITDANGRTSTVIATDVQGTNGVIHVIDTVILPSL